jgi:hypothetical protein
VYQTDRSPALQSVGRLQVGVLAIIAFASCLVTAAIVRAPIIYPDSIGYYQSGEAALQSIYHKSSERGAAEVRISSSGQEPLSRTLNTRDGVSSARSPYYGIFVALSEFAIQSTWGVVLFQFAILSVSIALAASLFLKSADRVALPATVGVCVAGGASLISCVVMPDIFAGLLVLALSVTLGSPRPIGRIHALWWLGLIALSVAVHKSHVVLAISLLLLSIAVLRRCKTAAAIGYKWVVMAIVGGILCHVVVDWRIKQLGYVTTSPPFLLARMIGDGTAEVYLRGSCEEHTYRTCQFLSHMPMTENMFLWSKDPNTGGFGLLDSTGKQQVISEQGTIVLETLKSNPFAQLRASSASILKQLFVVGGTEYGISPKALMKYHPTSHPMAAEVQAYTARQGYRQEIALKIFSVIMLMTYTLSLVYLIFSLFWLRRNIAEIVAFVAIIVAGIVTNAAVCGAISGVFDRYQGRVAWLALLAAFFVFTHQMSRKRSTAL